MPQRTNVTPVGSPAEAYNRTSSPVPRSKVREWPTSRIGLAQNPTRDAATDQASKSGDSNRATTCAWVTASRCGRSRGRSSRSPTGGSADHTWLRVAWVTTATPFPRVCRVELVRPVPHDTPGTGAATKGVLTDAGVAQTPDTEESRSADEEFVSVMCLSGCQFVCGLWPGWGADPQGYTRQVCVVALCGIVRCFEDDTRHRRQSTLAPDDRPSLTKSLPRALFLV